MSTPEPPYERVEDYLSGHLSAEETAQFEAELAENASLQEEVALFRMTETLMVAQATLQVREDVRAGFHKLKSRRMRQWILGGSAMVLLALVAGFYFWSAPQKPSQVLVEPLPPTEVPTTQPNLEPASEPMLVEPPNAENRKPTVVSPPAETVTTVEHRAAEVESEQSEDMRFQKDEPEISEEDEPVEILQEPKPLVVEPCQGVVLQLELRAMPSCVDKPTGIIYAKAKGGEAPYLYVLTEPQWSSPLGEFGGLSAGFYQFQVKDKNGCMSAEKEIEVMEKYCFVPKTSFTPGMETWDYQHEEAVVQLEIRAPSGSVVFREEGQNLSWDGTDLTRAQVPVGSYLYLVTLNGELIDKNYIAVIY